MRRRERPGKKQLYASAGVHVVAVVLAWGAQVTKVDPSDFETIQITLVSPPPAEEAPEAQPVVEEEIVVDTPEPVPEDEPPPAVEETRVEERPEPTPTPPPPEPEPEEPGERQIQRCFEYPRGGGRLETSVIFYISRDGTVNSRSIDFYERSGNVNFDYAAMGAVECAGRGPFGPLPEELGSDRLPILFSFRPMGGPES